MPTFVNRFWSFVSDLSSCLYHISTISIGSIDLGKTEKTLDNLNPNAMGTCAVRTHDIATTVTCAATWQRPSQGRLNFGVWFWKDSLNPSIFRNPKKPVAFQVPAFQPVALQDAFPPEGGSPLPPKGRSASVFSYIPK